MKVYNKFTSAFSELVGINNSVLQFDINDQSLIVNEIGLFDDLVKQYISIFYDSSLNVEIPKNSKYVGIFDEYMYVDNRNKGWIASRFYFKIEKLSYVNELLIASLSNAGLQLDILKDLGDFFSDQDLKIELYSQCNVEKKPLFQVFKSDTVMFLEILKWE